MRRRIGFVLHLPIMLALSACRIATASPSPMPDPTATTTSSRLPDADEVKARACIREPT